MGNTGSFTATERKTINADRLQMFVQEKLKAAHFLILIVMFLIVTATSSSVRADQLLIDFTSGPPPPEIAIITPLTPTTVLDFSQSKLTMTLNRLGDGTEIFVPNFDSMCLLFQGLDLEGFATGSGLELATLFGAPESGNSVRVQLIQSESIDVKIFDEENHITNRISQVTLDRYNVRDVSDVRLDWVFAVDNILLSIHLKDGTIHNALGHSRVDHFGQPFTRIHATFVERGEHDPTASIERVTLIDTHVPEPASILLLTTGSIVLMITLRRRDKSAAPRLRPGRLRFLADEAYDKGIKAG